MGAIHSDELGRAEIDYSKCVSCGQCLVNCPFGAIADKGQIYQLIQGFNKAAEELGGTEILRKDFINNFSHEFKTPIVSISGFADLLLEEQLPPEDQKEYLTIIRDESRRLADLATNILTLSLIHI